MLAGPATPMVSEVALNCPNDLRQRWPDLPVRDRQPTSAHRRESTSSPRPGTCFTGAAARHQRFYMLGWTPTTYDAHNAPMRVACRTSKGAGGSTSGRTATPKVDRLTRRISPETDAAQLGVRRAFGLHAADIGHLPLHRQSLAWGGSQRQLVQLADNFMPFKVGEPPRPLNR